MDEFYKREKEKPAQSRDDALYGVFASGGSSEDSDSQGGRRGKRLRGDSTKPSTGTVMPSKEIDEEVVKKENLGEEEEQGDEVSFWRTTFGRKIKEGAEQRKKEKEKEKDRTGSKKSSSVTGTGNVGTFETHTKGIGMKLMKMMGYKEGTGLGKNEQGIVAPVEAKLRPKNMGMGFNDYKEAELIQVQEEPVPVSKFGTSSGAVPISGRNRERMWSKQKQGKKKFEILTKDELLSQKQEQDVETVQKIIDMRGPQVRVLTNFENLNSETETETNNNIPMPELQYNMRLIVETTEADIQRKDRDLRKEREKVASLLKEKEKIKITELTQRRQLQNMETIMGVVEQINEDNGSGLLTLDSLLQTFSDLKQRYEEEYKMCNLNIIICASAHPLLLQIFHKWDPLSDPLHGFQIIKSFKDLLQGDQPYDYSDGTHSLTPYTQLINEIIVPAIQTNCTNNWQARDPEPLLTFLETWDPLLPPVILNSILENVILPKLNQAVRMWDPRVETVPIHVWIHPWLPLLGTKMEDLYNSIESKLSYVLKSWHANDSSALAILSPWKDVFAARWDRLMSKHIVPKLRIALQGFEINPANQKLDPFHWVMRWNGFVPVKYMVCLLEREFFTKWNQVLCHWLRSNPDFGEVTKWYMGWKNSFPEDLLANERIRVSFTEGLEMMNRAVEGMQVVPPGTRATEKRQMERMRSGGTGDDLSLKERVERYALEHGLVFMPRVGKFYNSYQVFDFGNVGVYVDSVKRLIFAQVESGVWSAVSLAQLTEMNRNSSNRK